jgi:hypothetical protein
MCPIVDFENDSNETKGSVGAVRAGRVAQQDIEAVAVSERAGKLRPARGRVGPKAARRALARVKRTEAEQGRAVERIAILRRQCARRHFCLPPLRPLARRVCASIQLSTSARRKRHCPRTLNAGSSPFCAIV